MIYTLYLFCILGACVSTVADIMLSRMHRQAKQKKYNINEDQKVDLAAK